MYQYKVRQVTRVVDGDTLDCVIDLGFGLRANFRFRLAGIDTPETYGKYAEASGEDAKQYTQRWIDDAVQGGLTVTTFKGSAASVGVGDGAFGRWLGAFTNARGDDLASSLRDAGHVKS